MYTEQAIMNRGADQEELKGVESLVGILTSSHHLAAVESGMAHVAAPPHIRIEGDRAVATGYLQIVVPNPVGPEVSLGEYPAARGLLIWRLTANRWELERTAHGWRVTKRSIRMVPAQNALDLLQRGIDSND
jgi:SnoaL-like domain